MCIENSSNCWKSVKTTKLQRNNYYFTFKERGDNIKFTEEEIKSIINDYNLGMTAKQLGQKYHRNSGTIIGKLQDLKVHKPLVRKWTNEDKIFLQQHYPNGEWDIIFERFPNLTKAPIHTYCNKIGIKSNSFWTNEEIALLINNYDKIIKEKGYNGLVELLNNKYSLTAVSSKCEKLNLKSREYWSEDELNILINNYSNLYISEIEKLLPNRNRKTIIMKACDLKLKSKLVLETWFTQEDLLYIENNYNKYTDVEIGNRLNKKAHAITDQRMKYRWIKEYEESSYPNLSMFLRKNNTEWKKLSSDNCNGVCIVTGCEYDDIHHIHSFNLIVDKTAKELNINSDKDINLFTDEELKNILCTFRKNQLKYPLGVCLTKDIHKLFHSIFGYGYNTQEQWDEFIQGGYYNSYKRECYESRKN